MTNALSAAAEVQGFVNEAKDAQQTGNAPPLRGHYPVTGIWTTRRAASAQRVTPTNQRDIPVFRGRPRNCDRTCEAALEPEGEVP